ncbi:hypothetical protein DHEL01_v209167 [Diaporthe helianthi]|uniref:Integral membrane protein n=1 Tax=Diaporthe helianthi TaxID=158607 RepID=A0A2P5HQA5_DIAHE|nr:hypothetical protein DHEL01_v209167 [Diaporthe helianthi]
MMLPDKPPRLISALNPIFAYLLGIGLLLIAFNCFLRPRHEYARFGLPLEDAHKPAKQKSHSPLIYLKGSRELTCGLALVVLQYQGNADGVTAIAGIISLAGLVDGLVVWFNGGHMQGLKHKTLGHFLAFVVLGSWAAWRTHQVWEDSKGRWPDGHFHILSS